MGRKRQVAATKDLPELSLEPAEVEKLVKSIGEKLQESNTELVEALIMRIGLEKGQELLEKTLEVEKGEGIKTADGERRKTAGGVFLHLARDEVGRAVFNSLSSRIHKRRKKEKSKNEAKKGTESSDKDDKSTPAKEGETKDKAAGNDDDKKESAEDEDKKSDKIAKDSKK